MTALARQSVSGFTILVVDSSTDGTAALVAECFPGVTLVRSESRLFPGDARNLALLHADTELIAFVDADCLADPDWVEQILDAHNRSEGRDWIIGGTVGVANPASVTGWALYFSEFSGSIPRGDTRHVADIPTCNLSFQRRAYDVFGPFLEGSYCSDTLFNWKAGEAGQQPLLIPGIHVKHVNPTDPFKMVRKLRMHGEAFARVRLRHYEWDRWTCFARSATALLLPPWLWMRTAARVIGSPGYRVPFLCAAPLLLVGIAAWSLGEAVGYAKGALEEEQRHESALEHRAGEAKPQAADGRVDQPV